MPDYTFRAPSGKTYSMPWNSPTPPTEKELDAFVSQSEGTATPQNVAFPSPVQQITEGAKTAIGIGKQFGETALKSIPGMLQYGLAVEQARLGAPHNLYNIAQEGAGQYQEEMKKAEEAPTTTERLGRKAGAYAGIVGLPITQTAEDIIKGDYGSALFHGGMSIAGGLGAYEAVRPVARGAIRAAADKARAYSGKIDVSSYPIPEGPKALPSAPPKGFTRDTRISDARFIDDRPIIDMQPIHVEDITSPKPIGNDYPFTGPPIEPVNRGLPPYREEPFIEPTARPKYETNLPDTVAPTPNTADFYAGSAGIAKAKGQYLTDFGPVQLNDPNATPGLEQNQLVRVPPITAAEYGTGLGKPLTAEPNAELSPVAPISKPPLTKTELMNAEIVKQQMEEKAAKREEALQRVKSITENLQKQNAAKENEDVQYSRVPKKYEYQDLTPGEHKQYKVYDENDVLIHETTDRNEAHDWADRENGYVKDIGEQGENEPQFAKIGERRGKIDVNVKRAAEELTSGYSQPLPAIMLREGMQNSLDAVKKLTNMRGQVHIKTSKPWNSTTHSYDPSSLTITDNGSGMSPDELFTVYTNLHETGKVNEAGASGGKGVGKAPFMLGGSHFTVTTTKEIGGKKIQSSFRGKPEELMSGFDVDTKEVSADTPTGTSFTTTLKPDQDAWYINNMFENIQKHSRDIPAQIDYEDHIGRNTHFFKKTSDDKVIIKDEPVTGSNVTISIPSDAQYKPSSSLDIKVLNNGMFQYSRNLYLGEETKGMPDKIILNIKPKVEEGSPDYPFPVQRESVKESIEAEIDKLIKDKLVNPFASQKIMDLTKLWNSMTTTKSTINSNRDVVFFDPGNRLTPEELEDFNTSPEVHDILQQLDYTIDQILKSSGSGKWQSKVERIGITLDPNMFGVHIPNPQSPRGAEKSAILINPFAHMEGIAASDTPENAALDTVVTMLHEVAHVGSENPQTLTPFKPSDLNDPRVGKFLETYLKQTLSHGGIDMGHGMPFIHRLGEIYAKYGTQRGLNAATKLQNIFTGKQSGGYSPEIQRLLQIYTKSRGRAATTEDILSGTGVKSRVEGTGEGNISGNDKPVREGTSLEPGESIAQKVAREMERQADTPLEKARAELDAAQWRFERLRKMRDERPGQYREFHGDMEKAIRDIDFYRQAIQRLKGREIEKPFHKQEFTNPRGNIREADPNYFPYGETAREWLQDSTGTLTDEGAALLRMLRDERGAVGKDIGPLRTVRGTGIKRERVPKKEMSNVEKTIYDIANVPQALQASLDLSAPFRQGAGAVGDKEFWTSLGPMIKSFFNEDTYNKYNDAIEKHPDHPLAVGSGVRFTELTTLNHREERFQSQLAEKLTRFGILPERHSFVKMSGRAYTSFLNMIRQALFTKMLDSAELRGDNPRKNPALAREFADTVNNITGRGKLGPETWQVPLNAFFFSPRLMGSRVKLLNPYTYINPKINRTTRLRYMRSLVSLIGTGLTIAAISKLFGHDVNLDTSSSDFGKVKVGKNTRFEAIPGGFVQYIRLISQIMPHAFGGGYKTSPITGKTVDLYNPKYGGPTALTQVMSFGRNKLSPVPSFGADVLSGTDFKGQPLQWKSPSIGDNPILSRLTPISTQDAQSIYQNEPDKRMLGYMAPAMLGLGVQTYSQQPFRTHRKGKLARVPKIR